MPLFDISRIMELSEATKALSALAQDSRLEVFRLLVKVGSEGLSAGEIASELEIPAATLSFHLNQLANAGLIDSERQSRSIIYALKEEGIRKLLLFLMEDCCQGRPELCVSKYCEDSSAPKIKTKRGKLAA